MRNKNIGLRQTIARVDVIHRDTDLDAWFWASTFKDERTNTFYFYNHLDDINVLYFLIKRFKDINNISQVEWVSLKKKSNLVYSTTLFIDGWPHDTVFVIKVLDEK